MFENLFEKFKLLFVRSKKNYICNYIFDVFLCPKPWWVSKQRKMSLYVKITSEDRYFIYAS
jgi:hypothetical protein